MNEPRTIEEQYTSAGNAGDLTVTSERRIGESHPQAVLSDVEAGHVVGTPFAQSDITDQVARLMVGFGCGFLVLWPHLAPNASPFTNMDVGHAD